VCEARPDRPRMPLIDSKSQVTLITRMLVNLSKSLVTSSAIISSSMS
jgi:hypothetical protein